jgi:hypothetical protein
MKVLIAVTILLIASLFCGVQASASTFIAGDLQAACPTSFEKDAKISIDNAMCVGYIAGWLDGINGDIIKKDDGKFVQFQLAKGVTTKQVIAVFLKYMEAHPEAQNKDGEEILMLSLLEVRLARFVPVVPESEIH